MLHCHDISPVSFVSLVIFRFSFVLMIGHTIISQTRLKLGTIGYMFPPALPKHELGSISQVRAYLRAFWVLLYHSFLQLCCSTTKPSIGSLCKRICTNDVCVFMILCLQRKQRIGKSTRSWSTAWLRSIPFIVPYS